MSKVRVLGVSGSPREGRNTDALLRAALEKPEAAGAEVELFSLAGLKILPCTGCNTCVKEKRCPQDDEDDMGLVKERLKAADAVVFAAPSYFGGIPRGYEEHDGQEQVPKDGRPQAPGQGRLSPLPIRTRTEAPSRWRSPSPASA